MKHDQQRKMDKGHFEPENHKFIIPNLRQRTQPGLEVRHYAEHEASSPEVVRAPASPFNSPEPADPAQQQQQQPQQQQQRQRDGSRRGAGNMSPSSSAPERMSDDGPQVSNVPGRPSGDSQRVLRPPTITSSSVRLQSMKVEDPNQDLGGKKRRQILGIPVMPWWLLIFVAILAVNAIAVGVALGVTRKDSPPPNPTSKYPTWDDQSVAGAAAPAPVNQYCPSDNGTVIVPYDASGSPIVFNQEQPMSFQMLCNTYWPAKGPNLSLRDILVVWTPDMYTCMSLCAAYNSGYSDAVGDDVYVGGGICVSVALVKGPAQFCHLQNATGVNDTGAAFGFSVDTAVLVGDWVDMTTDNQTVAFGGNLPDPEDTNGDGSSS